MKKQLIFCLLLLTYWQGQGQPCPKFPDTLNLISRAVELHESNPDSALLLLDRLIELAESQFIDTVALAVAYNIKGTIERDRGEYRAGRRSYVKSEELLSQLRSAECRIGRMKKNWSRLEAEAKHIKRAHELIDTALNIAYQVVDSLEVARCLINRGNIFHMENKFDKAKNDYLEALKLLETLQIQDENAALIAKQNLGVIAISKRQYDTALHFLIPLYSFYEEKKDSSGLADVANKLGAAYLYKGNLKLAHKYLLEAKDIAEDIPNYRLLSEVENNINYLDTSIFYRKRTLWWSLLAFFGVGTGIGVIISRWRNKLKNEQKKRGMLDSVVGDTETILQEISQTIHSTYTRDADSIKKIINRVLTKETSISDSIQIKLKEVFGLACKTYDITRGYTYLLNSTDVKWESLIKKQILAYQIDNDAEIDFKTWGINQESYTEYQSHGILDILQNLITNIEKHAKATKIKISFQQRGDNLILHIEDNGKGFDWPSTKGVGLKSVKHMTERELGGKLNIASTKQGFSGTRVRIVIPIGKSVFKGRLWKWIRTGYFFIKQGTKTGV